MEIVKLDMESLAKMKIFQKNSRTLPTRQTERMRENGCWECVNAYNVKVFP